MIDDDEDQAPDDADPLLASETPTVDASSVRTVRKRVREAERQEQEKRAFWEAVFANPVGRREMWAILSKAGAFEVKFGVGPNGFPQSEASLYYAAQRDFGQCLYLTFCSYAREDVLRMHDEYDTRVIAFKKDHKKRND